MARQTKFQDVPTHRNTAFPAWRNLLNAELTKLGLPESDVETAHDYYETGHCPGTAAGEIEARIDDPPEPPTGPAASSEAPATYMLGACPAFDPITTPDRCKHQGHNAMTVGLRSLTGKGQRGLTVDGDICMACGTMRAGHLTAWETLSELEGEWGAVMTVGVRIRDLVQVLAQRALDAAGVKKVRRSKYQRGLGVSFGPDGLFIAVYPSGRMLLSQPAA